MDGTHAVEEPLVNTADIALIFGVSEVTVKKWHKDPVDPMPVETHGGNGVAYEFRVADCRAWYDRKKAKAAEAERTKQEYLQKQRLEFLGLRTDDEQAGLSAQQMRELAAAQLVIMQAAERRRALVHADEVRELLDAIMSEFQAGLDGIPDWLEREFSLTGEQVERAVEYGDQMISGILRRLSSAVLEEIEDLPAEPELF